MTRAELRYDVAFSFLAEDEGLAAELDRLLSGRLETFLYSKKQEEIAGTDGEETFGRVFSEEARVVVVLYRSGWGGTPWTRIEETAIRNRGYEEGYDFALFVPLDDPPNVPKWLPKNRMWIGLERWGVESAAAVIEARVQEEGGEPRPETVEVKAAKVKEERAHQERRRRFLGSKAGVEAAKGELQQVMDRVEELVEAISDPGTNLTFRFVKEDRQIALFSHGYSVSVALAIQWRNTLDDSGLYVKVWDGRVRIGGGIPMRQATEIRGEEYELDLDRRGNVGWSSTNGGFKSSRDLAEHVVEMLLDRI